MKTLKKGKTPINIGLTVMIWLLAFQSPLESVSQLALYCKEKICGRKLGVERHESAIKYKYKIRARGEMNG